jgi:hypothetical protein
LEHSLGVTVSRAAEPDIPSTQGTMRALTVAA